MRETGESSMVCQTFASLFGLCIYVGEASSMLHPYTLIRASCHFHQAYLYCTCKDQRIDTVCPPVGSFAFCRANHIVNTGFWALSTTSQEHTWARAHPTPIRKMKETLGKQKT